MERSDRLDGVVVRRLAPGDAEAVVVVFTEGIASGDATVEMQAPS